MNEDQIIQPDPQVSQPPQVPEDQVDPAMPVIPEGDLDQAGLDALAAAAKNSLETDGTLPPAPEVPPTETV